MGAKRLATGEILGGRYRIVSIIGQGGMSQVYLAEDLKLKGKKWAVKQCWSMSHEIACFMEEAEMLAQLRHPQMPQLVDYLAPDLDGYAYLIMDYISGPTLQDLFEERGRELPVPMVVDFAIQLCELFQYLHTFRPRPIIYRDLKPSNVMIGDNQRIRLIDFGVARHYTLGKDSDTMQIGTIGFAAPEQFITAQTDPRSDLYNLGAMLYYLFTRGHYFYVTKVPLSELRPDLPIELIDTVQMLLEHNPQLRCQSAQEVMKRLMSVSSAKTEVRQLSSNGEIGHDSDISNRLIVVGGLYPGVGSTFMAVALARVLDKLRIPHALVEHPLQEPDLYMMLYGDQYAPESYQFATDLKGMASASAVETVWRNGYTTWVPANPNGSAADWDASEFFKLLYQLKKPIVIWDVSSNWLEPSVQELCLSADAIVAVLDASPGKLNRASTKKKLEQLQAWSEGGQTVYYAGNREVPSFMRGEWEAALPAAPVCMIPDIPYEQVLHALWKGRCVQDQAPWLEKLYTAFLPLLQAIIPDDILLKKKSKPSSLLALLRGG